MGANKLRAALVQEILFTIRYLGSDGFHALGFVAALGPGQCRLQAAVELQGLNLGAGGERCEVLEAQVDADGTGF